MDRIGLATNAPRLIVDFELGILNLDEKTFFDSVLLAEEFGIGKIESIIWSIVRQNRKQII